VKKDMLRVAAVEKGEKFYTPENPCVRGHVLRRTSDGTCVFCKQEAERKRIAADRLAYNARKKKERALKLEEYAQKMRERRANETPEKRALRLEKAKEKQRVWRIKNKDHIGIKQSKQRYKERNIGKVRADTVRRRLAKIQRTPLWLDKDELWLIEQAYDLAALRSKIFGFQWHVDHILPLQGKFVSGLHVPKNLQVIPWIDNVKKSNKVCA
jgi:hypothetical protein